jgi:ADP-ribose pyrophosphatase
LVLFFKKEHSYPVSTVEPMTDSGIKTLSSRIAYENRWTRLREDIIRWPDGSEGLYGVVERADFVVIFPHHANGDVTLVEQYRYPVRRRMIELPMGMWEEKPGTDPAEVARGELAEETGLLATSLIRVGEVFQGAGYSNQRGHVFHATGLRRGEARREISEQDMTTHRMPIDQLEAMIRGGEITDAITIAAFALLRLKFMI